MTPQEFMENFGTLADAPGGIGNLRELVLELAVRGRLVEQELSECAASIDDARKPTRGRRPRADETSHQSEPWELPANWRWIPVTSAFEMVPTSDRKILTSQVQEAGQFPVVDQGKVLVRGYVDDEALLIRPGGPVVVFGDHTKQVKFVDFDFVAGADGTKILKPKEAVDPRYFYWCLRSYKLGDRGYARHFGLLAAKQFPLPPLAEQKRIVAKVDQLMALLDDLEAKQGKRQHTVVRATSACLDALTTADSPEEVANAWKRVAGNCRVLFDRPEAVGELRRAVLELGVRGRLVDATLDLVAQEGAPFPVPAGWNWSTIGALGQTLTGTTPSTRNPEFYGDHIPFVAPGDIADRTLVLPPKGLSKLGLAEGRLVPAGSVLMVCIGGSIGKAAGNDVDVACNQQINAVTPKKGVVRDYLLAAMRAPYFQREVMGRALQGTLPIISKSKWEQIPVPVPPQPMQAKIAAAVGRAFVMCDDLEGKLRRRDERAGKLVAAVVGEIVGAGSHGEVMPTEPSEDRRYATAQETLARVNAAADRKNSRGKNTAVSKARPARKMATT